MFQSLYRPAIITLALTGYVHSSSTFQWPNPLLTYADKQLYEVALDFLTLSCPLRENSTVPAQWLRINIGPGMFDTLNDFNAFAITTPFFGLADTIALGAVFAVAGCGGPFIPYSASRVDATVAGPETVPEPQQDLASHTETFRRQGFTPTEMIGLVACRHTLGGVRQVDFPLVVTDPEDYVQTVDTTKQFDNAVVTEYLQNTTQNSLVVGPNVTTRSDFRIFSSDGNVTMQSFLSSDTFNETCRNLIQRMINTVPSSVNLTQPMSQPFDHVASDPLLSYRNDTLSMATTLRVLGESTSRTITMLWANQKGSFCLTTGCTSLSTGTELVSFTVISTRQGQDSVFIDNSRSETVFPPPSLVEQRRIVMAVRGDASSSVSITTFDPVSNASVPPYLPTVATTILQLDETNPSDGGFTFFTTNVSHSVTSMDIVGNIGGISYTQNNFDMTAVNFTISQ
ncbi:heme peroxidase [Lentinula aciculospora]|uniref:Peroxidase n=1 Tax=Lentinula aciculospora TaxID=153920 RepID=A0A9W9A3Z2_9AGAR|nr:heme peroxidase [Lentinula aciculospora]